MYFKKFIATQPIGIFDSGIGGLTAAKAIRELLPQESLIYVADTQNLPYGEKTASQIQDYSFQITQWLIEQNCKVIVMACNTASSCAAEFVRERFPGQIILDVITPTVEYLTTYYAGKRVGLIGTQRTIDSHAYSQQVDKQCPSIELCSLATPLLVPCIEKNFGGESDCRVLIANYLSHPSLENIEALVLGCTHYPLITDQIAAFYQNYLPLIDTSIIVAKKLQQQLLQTNLLNTNTTTKAVNEFHTTQHSQAFSLAVKDFFNQQAQLLILEKNFDVVHI